MVSAGTVAVLYIMEHGKVTAAINDNSALQLQATALQSQIKQQDDINKGIAKPANAYKDPAGGLGMVDGAVTFTLPKDWARAAASSCQPGANITSQVLCYDVAKIKPASADWSANVAVYEYSSAVGTARQWVETKYSEPLSNFVEPSVKDIVVDPIGGNSAISYNTVSGTASNPNYIYATYVVVHGKYAVVVTAQVQTKMVGQSAYDYRQTYQPALKQFIDSVRFKD
jgi:hypothetical protein